MIRLAALAICVVVPVAAHADILVLTEGTPIMVRTLYELTSKHAEVGDQVEMEVTEDVMVGGNVIIPAGAPAYGEVTDAQRNGHVGKSGKLSVDVTYVKLGDHRLRVRGKRATEGQGGGGATIATTVLLSPLGLLVHGKSAKIPMHTVFTAYVTQDTSITVDKAIPSAPIALPSGSGS